MIIGNYLKCLQGCIFLLVLTMGSMVTYAAEDAEIIEFQGDRYVIHVDRMNPDSEMTLLDVLNTCPEYISLNGKMIDLLRIWEQRRCIIIPAKTRSIRAEEAEPGIVQLCVQ